MKWRCAETNDDVLLEVQVPFWIEASDVHVDIGEQQLQVSVRNTLCFCRTYWTNRCVSISTAYSTASVIMLSCSEMH